MSPKTFIILLFVITYGNFIQAQLKTLHIPERNKTWGYTAEAEKAKAAEFKIKSLSTDTTADEHYRLSNSRQIIDVWRKDTVFEGQVISFTRTYIPSEKRETEKSKLISNCVTLTADTAKLIFYTFKSVDSIPDMEQLKNWHRGFDGETYAIERSSPKALYLKSYWSPGVQRDSAAFKKEIVDFLSLIYKGINLYRYYDYFFDTLPGGSYTDGFINTSIMRHKSHHSKKK